MIYPNIDKESFRILIQAMRKPEQFISQISPFDRSDNKFIIAFTYY